MANHQFPRMGSEMISPPRLNLVRDGSSNLNIDNALTKHGGQVSNPELLIKDESKRSRLDRLHGRNNSIGYAQTGATSGAALLTEEQTDIHTRKQSIQNFSMGMEAVSRATPSGFRASPDMIRDDSVQMLDNPHIDSQADLLAQIK